MLHRKLNKPLRNIYKNNELNLDDLRKNRGVYILKSL